MFDVVLSNSRSFHLQVSFIPPKQTANLLCTIGTNTRKSQLKSKYVHTSRQQHNGSIPH